MASLRGGVVGTATLFLSLFLPFSYGADLAAPPAYEGRPVAQVRFDPPSQPVAPADLAKLVPFVPGTPLRLADVQAAIKHLYGTGFYSNIEVETEPAPNGLTLVFHTSGQWFVGPLEVRGMVKMPPNEGQLANAARLQLGEPFHDDDVETAVEGIRGLLHRNGLYLATVEPKIERDAPHQLVSISFQVNSGKRARLMLPAIIGDTRIPPATLAKAAKYKGWFRWKPATDEITQAGLHNIRARYDKQDRLTASVTLDHMDFLSGENRLRPTIRAEGGPRVRIRTQGAKVSRGNLEKYIPVFDEDTVNRDLLVTGVRNLRDYFQGQGYFDVKVDFENKPAGADEQEINYLVDLGVRHKVVRVDIQGNHYFTADVIRERMFLEPAGFLRLRHGRYSQGFVDSDRDAIEALYRDNGFRDCKVNVGAADDYQGKVGGVDITLAIDEGPQYRVAKIVLDGVTHPDKSALMSRLASLPGQPYSEASVARDRDAILGVYLAGGYPQPSFDWHMTPGPGAHQVTLQYVVTEGSPRYVREVVISGLHITRKELIDPDILLKPGDSLSWATMGDMQRRMYNLGVFDQVDMAIENPQGNAEYKNVLFGLTEARRYSLAVGVGAEIARFGGSQTSLDNPAGATGFAPRFDLDLSRLNLWGLGQSLTFKGRYSTLDRRLSLTYLAPHYRHVAGRDITVSALYDNTRDVLTFTARRLEGSLQLSQRLSKSTTGQFRYTWRDVQVDQNTLKINPLLIPLVSQPARLGILSTSLIQDRRDDPANAHRGVYNSVDLGVVDHYFGGNKDYVRFLGQNSYYKTIFKDLVLASNTEFGWIHPFSVPPGGDPFEYVPISERFFGGGSTSHRGFPYDQAGPRDPLTGFPLGGNALLFHSTELRFPFIGDNIDGVLFHDMGNIYKDVGSISFRVHQMGPIDAQHSDFDYMVHAAGFGIRYRTPVGPLRLDLAYSINPPTFNGLKGTYQQLLFNTATPTIQHVSHLQFFFSIGQAF